MLYVLDKYGLYFHFHRHKHNYTHIKKIMKLELWTVLEKMEQHS